MRLTTRSVNTTEAVSSDCFITRQQSKPHRKAVWALLGWSHKRQPAPQPQRWPESRAEEMRLYHEGFETLKPICLKYNLLNLLKHQNYPYMCIFLHTEQENGKRQGFLWVCF